MVKQWGHYTYPTYERYQDHAFVLPVSFSSTYSYSIVVTASGDDAGERITLLKFKVIKKGLIIMIIIQKVIKFN